MSRVNWCNPRRSVQWLGAAQKGKSDWTPLEKEMISRKGGTSEDDFKAYGTVAGTIGGASLCIALVVSAPLVVGCGVLGGIIGGIIGGVIGKQWQILFGKKTDEEQLAVYWNKAVNQGKKSGKGILAVKAYLTMRDYAMSRGYSDEWLTKKGFPPAPVIGRWKPSQARYDAAKQNFAFCEQAVAKGGIKSNDCSVAKGLGIVDANFSCAEFLWFTFFNGSLGPVSSPSEPIDWYAVGRDEAAAGNYLCKDVLAFPTTTKGKFLDTGLSCPNDTERPTIKAKGLIAGLNKLPAMPPPEAAAPPSVSAGGGAKTSPVVVVGGLAAVAAAVWYFFL